MCKVSWCEDKIAKLGYCNRHYLQMRRFGEILPIKRNRSSSQEFEFYGKDCHILLYDKNGDKITNAIIDTADYDIVKDYKFNFSGRRYVRVTKKTKEGFEFLHQLLMSSKWIDHKDGDRLNNRRSNLRLCTNQQNQFNQKCRINTFSEYKGVTLIRNRPKPFRSWIQINGKGIHLGSFLTENEAALAYNEAAEKYFGEFANLNVIK